MSPPESFVRVDPETRRFSLNGARHDFLGANFWYGMPLGSAGPGGDRARLRRELDTLSALGAKNLRVMAASEGPDTEPWRMSPALQPEPGRYDEAQLEGLDHLLSEMADREMKAVVCLGNTWQWSGGFAAYVSWARGGEAIPYPGHSQAESAWDDFQRYASSFYDNPQARRLYSDHVEKIVGRTSSITGVPYRDDPTIMAFQLANEPRGHEHADGYLNWVAESAALIKRLDPNHLVSIGSEGETPWPSYVNTRFREVHSLPDVDYLTVHLWVQNWHWYDPASGRDGLRRAIESHVTAYLDDHFAIAEQLGKPLVLEEFGISRDGGSHDPRAPSEVRDAYYAHVFAVVAEQVARRGPLSGVNFWAWAGEGRPSAPGADWKPGDPYTGDPPHEPQGWYGVYDRDESTRRVLRQYAGKINAGG